MNSTTIAVDVAKAVFEVAVSEPAGQVRERHRFSRERFRRYLGEQPPATILMEACGSAHYWGREAQTRGHRVVLLPPARRAALRRPQQDQSDLRQGPARGDAQRRGPARARQVGNSASAGGAASLRSTWLATRTARINTVRGLLREFGVVIPIGARPVVPALGSLEDDDVGVPSLLRPALAERRPGNPGARKADPHRRAPAGRRRRADAGREPSVLDPRRRALDRHGPRRRRRRCAALSLCAAFRQLPRPDAAGALDGPAPAARCHQQAG